LYRPVKKIEQYTTECRRLLRRSDVAGGKLHIFEELMPLEGRGICKFMSWLTTMVTPVPSGIQRCFWRKRMFLWNRSLSQRHRFIRRRRGGRVATIW
jgi:hypothetical protein